MQYFLIWAGNRRNTAPKQQQKPADQKTAGMQKNCVYHFHFRTYTIGKKNPNKKPHIRYPQTGYHRSFFLSHGYFVTLCFGKKRMVDWNSLSLLRKHESTLHSYAPHFPTSRLRGRQKSLSKNMHLRKYSLQSKDNLFYCRISQKRRAEFTLLPYALEH